MKNFVLTSTIPTSTTAYIKLKNDVLFFASYTSLYNPSLFFTSPDPIVAFDISEHIFVLTEKELLQIDRFGKVLTNMKMTKRCRNVICHNSNVYLFKNNCIEIFKIPVCYSNVTYKLVRRIFIEELVVNASFYEDILVTQHKNNSISIFNIVEGKEMLIGTYIEDVINTFITKDRITVVCKNSVIIYEYTLCHEQDEFIYKSIVKKIRIEKIVAAAYENKDDTIYIAFENEEGFYSISTINDCELTETFDEKYVDLVSITVEGKSIAIKTKSEIQKYNYSTKTHDSLIDTSEILCCNYFRDLIYIAATDSIKIYKNQRLLRKHKSDVETKIVFIHGTQNTILTVSSLGTARLYDANQFHCFKTFDLPFSVLASEINEDMSLLFFANSSIYVYDMKKGRQVDELKGHTGPIIKLIYKDGNLYSLGLDNFINKQSVFDAKGVVQQLENISNKTIIDFTISNNIYVLFDTEICIFDARSDFLQTFYIEDKRKIRFEKIAVVNECFVAVYGKHKNYKNETICLVQIYNTSFSIKIQEFTCHHTDSIKAFNSEFILQSTQFMHIYGQKSKTFDPVELETDCSPEKVKKLLYESNFYSALLCALKLKDDNEIEKVINAIPKVEIQEIAKLMPRKFVKILRLYMSSLEKVSIEWIKNLTYYHSNIGKELQLNEIQTEIYQKMRENKYMLDVIIRKQ